MGADLYACLRDLVASDEPSSCRPPPSCVTRSISVTGHFTCRAVSCTYRDESPIEDELLFDREVLPAQGALPLRPRYAVTTPADATALEYFLGQSLEYLDGRIVFDSEAVVVLRINKERVGASALKDQLIALALRKIV
jgi:hypothetical protein